MKLSSIWMFPAFALSIAIPDPSLARIFDPPPIWIPRPPEIRMPAAFAVTTVLLRQSLPAPADHESRNVAPNCALPSELSNSHPSPPAEQSATKFRKNNQLGPPDAWSVMALRTTRSEERRVGKECRS